MKIDITTINKYSVIDSCSIQNILSSSILNSAVNNNKFLFCTTKFVGYEMLHKRSKNPTVAEIRIKDRFKKELARGNYKCYNLSIEDLQDVEVLDARMKLGKGELSSIVFAKKTSQGFMTDDQKARELGAYILGSDFVQTTPNLLGWLFYQRILIDSELNEIITEHNINERPLEKYFKEVYEESLRIRLMIDHAK